MDEKSMILEQERQKKAKRRKKHKKLKVITGILAVFLLSGGTWYMVKGRYLLEENSTTVEIAAGEGQELIYAKIVSINGNEVTYTITDAPMTNVSPTQGIEQGGKINKTANVDEFQQGGQMPNMSSGQMPDMSSDQIPNMSSGQMSDMSSDQMPNINSERVQSGSTTEERGRGNGKGSGRNNNEQSATARKETETITTYIPVGTEVTTKLGTITTFSRLSAGDYVALITEKDGEEDIIVAVYIIG